MLSSLFTDVVVQTQQSGAQVGAAQAAATASHEPVTIVCPACNTQVTSAVEYSMGICVWLWVVVLLLLCWYATRAAPYFTHLSAPGSNHPPAHQPPSIPVHSETRQVRAAPAPVAPEL